MAASPTAMLGTEDHSEGEALVDEAEAPRAARRWGRKAVLALALAGAGACAAPRLWHSGQAVPAKRKHLFAGETLQAYERLERLLTDATTIEGPPPPSGLNETSLMYTQCSINVAQAALYLGQAVVLLDKVQDYPGYTCPDDTQRGCTVMVEGITTLLLWVMSFLSSAATTCAATINYPAWCAVDITAVMGDMGAIAFSSTAVADDCYFKKGKPEWASVLRVWNESRHMNYFQHTWTTFGRRLSGPPSRLHSVLDPMKELVEKHREDAMAHHMQNLDLTLCAFDVVTVVSYIIRAVKQIMQSTLDTCDDPSDCTITLVSMISTFSWLAQFWAYAFGDCAEDGNQRAYCAGDISGIMAGTTNLISSAMLIGSDCGAAMDPANRARRLRVPSETP